MKINLCETALGEARIEFNAATDSKLLTPALCDWHGGVIHSTGVIAAVEADPDSPLAVACFHAGPPDTLFQSAKGRVFDFNQGGR